MKNSVSADRYKTAQEINKRIKRKYVCKQCSCARLDKQRKVCESVEGS